MIIPHKQIAPETLHALLESYANRDGTDYGEVELSLEDKVRQLESALERGDIVLCYEEQTDSINLMTAQAAKQVNVSQAD